MLKRWSRRKTAILLMVFGTVMLIVLGHLIHRRDQISSSREEIKTEHFAVSYHGIPNKEAQGVADALEQNYERLLQSLNVADHPVVTVYLHPTQQAFDEATGWTGSTGTSAGPQVIHLSWSRADTKAAVHEFVHTLQLNRLTEHGVQAGWSDDEFEKRFSAQYPRWLWESVSIYLAGESCRWCVFFLMRDGHQPALSTFTRDNNEIYSVGYTIGEYIVTEWGEEKLAALVSSFGDVEATLGMSAEEFQQGWHEFVSANYLTL